MNDHTNYNFVLRLSIQQVEDMMDDIFLYQNGYEFFYAVDTYDFIHYFIPYFDGMYFKNSNLNFVAQESIAYESFFPDSKDDSILILDEYKFELLGVRDLFIQRIKEGNDFLANFTNLTSQMNQLDKSSREVLYEEIKKNFELFFLLLILSKKAGFKKENIFFQFLRKKMHISGFDTGNVEFDDFATKVFSETPQDDFVTIVYDHFIDLRIDFLETLKEENRNKYLENTYIYIQSIKRVLYANSQIAKSEKFSKKVIYYLSSTPNKSNQIFNIIDQELSDRYCLKWGDSEKKYTINRNIFQFFITKMLLREYSKSPSKPLKLLEALKNEILEAKKKSKKKRNKNVNKEAISEINYLLQKHSFNIENALYSGMLPNYVKTLDQITKENIESISTVQKELMDFFSEFLSEYGKDAENTNIAYNVAKYRQLNLIKNILETEDSDRYKIRIRFSEDVVRFNYHHLPFLLFINDNWFIEKYASFYEAMLRISEIEDEQKSQIGLIIPFLRKLFEDKIVSESESYNNKIESLISIFIDMITINKNKKTELLNNEKEIIDILEEQCQIYKEIIKPKLTKPKEETGNGNNVSNEYLLKEINYVLLWLYRRNGFTDKGITLGNSLIKNNDPRIFHGLALCYLANFYGSNNEIEENALIDPVKHITLKQILKLLQKSEKGYIDRLSRVQNNELQMLIHRTLIAVYNSSADCWVKKYLSGNKTSKEPLDKARNYIKKIKKAVVLLNIEYEDLPVPNNTEAEIEFYEASYYRSIGSKVEAREKIKFAKDRFEISCKRNSSMHKGFYKIGKEITKFYREIDE